MKRKGTYFRIHYYDSEMCQGSIFYDDYYMCIGKAIRLLCFDYAITVACIHKIEMISENNTMEVF